MSTTHPTLDEVRRYISEQKEKGKIDTGQENWRTQLPKFPKVSFPDGATFDWVIETGFGEVRIRMMPDVAPEHVANYLYLTELGFFDDLDFHRVIPGFMAQGGCPIGTGTGGPGYEFAGEYSTAARHDRPGLLSMANAGPGTDGSQFFLTFTHTPHLDDMHTIFGEVVEGMDAVRNLEERGSGSGAPSEPLPMIRARIEVA
jgi:peptidyl-prolyl cis-trans isomerase B (cyclophilin B)